MLLYIYIFLRARKKNGKQFPSKGPSGSLGGSNPGEPRPPMAAPRSKTPWPLHAHALLSVFHAAGDTPPVSQMGYKETRKSEGLGWESTPSNNWMSENEFPLGVPKETHQKRLPHTFRLTVAHNMGSHGIHATWVDNHRSQLAQSFAYQIILPDGGGRQSWYPVLGWFKEKPKRQPPLLLVPPQKNERTPRCALRFSHITTFRAV